MRFGDPELILTPCLTVLHGWGVQTRCRQPRLGL
jgi:hypothetical protein